MSQTALGELILGRGFKEHQQQRSQVEKRGHHKQRTASRLGELR